MVCQDYSLCAHIIKLSGGMPCSKNTHTHTHTHRRMYAHTYTHTHTHMPKARSTQTSAKLVYRVRQKTNHAIHCLYPPPLPFLTTECTMNPTNYINTQLQFIQHLSHHFQNTHNLKCFQLAWFAKTTVYVHTSSSYLVACHAVRIHTHIHTHTGACIHTHTHTLTHTCPKPGPLKLLPNWYTGLGRNLTMQYTAYTKKRQPNNKKNQQPHSDYLSR